MRSIRVAATGVLTLVALGVGSASASGVGPWSADAAVGPNEITYTLDLRCENPGLVCSTLDAYVDVQTAAVTGTGAADLDLLAGSWQVLADPLPVDLMDGAGARTTFGAFAVADVRFAPIPLVGAPETTSGVFVLLSNPLFETGGALTVGDYPIAATVSIAASADVVGPVDPLLPRLVVGPGDDVLTGTLRVLSISPGGRVEYEIRDLTGQVTVARPGMLLGEEVVVDVTADLVLNLSGQAGVPPVPALGGVPAGLLVLLLAACGARAAGRTRFKTEADSR